MEIGRLGAATLAMVSNSVPKVLHGTEADLDTLQEMDNDVDQLHGAIITYLGRLSQEDLSERQTELLHDYMAAANYMENIGDIIETNLVDAGRQRLNAGLVVSPETERLLMDLHQKVTWSVERAIQATVEYDKDIAREVMDAKTEINRLIDFAEEHLVRRLAAPAENRLVAFRLETEIMEYLRRMYYFAKRMAKLVFEEDMAYLHEESGEDLPQSIEDRDESGDPLVARQEMSQGQ